MICVLSLIPSKSLPEIHFDLLAPDKLAHAAVYALLSFLTLLGFEQRTWRSIFWSFVLPTILGILLEICQYLFFPDRYFEFFDIIANILGAIIGIIALIFYHKTLSVWIFQLLAVLFLV